MYGTPVLPCLVREKRGVSAALHLPEKNVSISSRHWITLTETSHSIYPVEEQHKGAQRKLENSQIIALLSPVMFSLFSTE